MKIVQVSYRRLLSRPGFTNEAVEMTATLDEGDSVRGVMTQLRNRVNDELAITNTMDEDKRQELRNISHTLAVIADPPPF